MVGIIKQTGTVNKNSGIFISKKMIAEIGFILVIAVIAVIVMEAFQSPTTSTGLQQKNTQQAEQAAYTGSANPSQANNAGQETILGSEIGWLPITGEPLDIELTGYESVVRVYVYANGKIDAELRDENLMKQQKAVGVKILLKNENNKIYETGQLTLGRIAMSSFIGDWKTVTGIENPTKLKWQPQFTIVDRELPQKSVKKVTT